MSEHPSGRSAVEEHIEVPGANDIEDGTMRAIEVDGHKLLVAKAEGEYLVADAHCPHMHADLSKGELDGAVVTCPWHGSRFDLRDGSVLEWTDFSGAVKRMAEFVRHPRPLRVYETSVEDGTLFVGPQKEPGTSPGQAS